MVVAFGDVTYPGPRCARGHESPGFRLWLTAVVGLLMIALPTVPATPAGAEASGNPAGTERVVAGVITAGDFHTCAIVDVGAVKCWGNNLIGQLGLGDTNDRGDDPG